MASMIAFICGVLLGGIIGFVVCAVVMAGKVLNDWERLINKNDK